MVLFSFFSEFFKAKDQGQRSNDQALASALGSVASWHHPMASWSYLTTSLVASCWPGRTYQQIFLYLACIMYCSGSSEAARRPSGGRQEASGGFWPHPVGQQPSGGHGWPPGGLSGYNAAFDKWDTKNVDRSSEAIRRPSGAPEAVRWCQEAASPNVEPLLGPLTFGLDLWPLEIREICKNRKNAEIQYR